MEEGGARAVRHSFARRAAGGLLLVLATVVATWSHGAKAAGGTPFTLSTQASGVFINMRGDVLTARHAVVDCPRLFVLKNGKVEAAGVLAVSNEVDAAVLRTTLKPLLAATFAETLPPAQHSVAVFSEAYETLQQLRERGRILGNALTVPGQPGVLQMISGAHRGASGSAVLDSAGLLLGIVAERVAAGSGVSGGTAGEASLLPTARPGMATLVRAVPSPGLADFLDQADIPYARSGSPQLGVSQSPASRAATLAVGIICG